MDGTRSSYFSPCVPSNPLSMHFILLTLYPLLPSFAHLSPFLSRSLAVLPFHPALSPLSAYESSKQTSTWHIFFPSFSLSHSFAVLSFPCCRNIQIRGWWKTTCNTWTDVQICTMTPEYKQQATKYTKGIRNAGFLCSTPGVRKKNAYEKPKREMNFNCVGTRRDNVNIHWHQYQLSRCTALLPLDFPFVLFFFHSFLVCFALSTYLSKGDTIERGCSRYR